jgi:hypothetical protein
MNRKSSCCGRVVAHIDLDCFYVQVFVAFYRLTFLMCPMQVERHHNPSALNGKPVGVAQCNVTLIREVFVV